MPQCFQANLQLHFQYPTVYNIQDIALSLEIKPDYTDIHVLYPFFRNFPKKTTDMPVQPNTLQIQHFPDNITVSVVCSKQPPKPSV